MKKPVVHTIDIDRSVFQQTEKQKEVARKVKQEHSMYYKTKRRWGWALIILVALILLTYVIGITFILVDALGWKGTTAVYVGVICTSFGFSFGIDLIGSIKK